MPTLDLTTYKFADHDDNAAAALYGTPFLYPAVPSAGGGFSNTDTALYGTAFPGSAVPSADGDFSNAGTGLYGTLIPDPAVPGAGGIFLPADPPFIDSAPGAAIGGFSTADAAVGVFDSRPGAASTPPTSGGAPVLGMSASSNTGGAKRKAGDADGSRHRKKSRKSKSDATGDPDPDAPKVRKVRSDKGSTQGSKDGTENAPDPVARVRKVRSDKGKPRDKMSPPAPQFCCQYHHKNSLYVIWTLQYMYVPPNNNFLIQSGGHLIFPRFYGDHNVCASPWCAAAGAFDGADGGGPAIDI
ncbi:hypothetical protein B0H15DRAFT_806487 [Mycena belliarum]|uniref:Uncharacterized protein n=1 Tax=Mycena belliarum TaxID=1033014 RepID=A0AAD6TRE0_9AGAR|nr:hypothetical protein B0H15DRAFT_806487 [Mycena belliae]